MKQLLDGCPIGDLSISAIAHAAAEGALPRLKELSFSYTQATNEGLIALAAAIRSEAFNELELLNFGWPRPKDEDQASLSELRKVLRLRIPFPVRKWPASMDEGLVAIVDASWCNGKSTLSRLRSLGLQSDFSDSGFEAIYNSIVHGGLPSLRILRVRLELLQINPTTFAQLMNPIRLCDGTIMDGLEVVLPECTNSALDRIVRFAKAHCPVNVTRLDCSGDDESPDVLYSIAFAAKLGGLPRLASLDLGNALLLDSYLDALATCTGDGALPCLQSLSLASSQVTDSGVGLFLRAIANGNCANFRALDLHDTAVTDATIFSLIELITLSAFAELEILDLSNTVVSDVGVDALAQAALQGRFKHLTRLLISDTQTTDDGLRAIANAKHQGKFPRLTTLHVHCDTITIVNGEVLRSHDAKRICEAALQTPPDRAHLSRRLDESVLRWFEEANATDWLSELQLFWCIGTTDHSALMSCGKAKGAGQLDVLFDGMKNRGDLGPMKTGETRIRMLPKLLETIFKPPCFPREAWEDDESNTAFLVPNPKHKGSNIRLWSPRARKAWLYVDRYLKLQQQIPFMRMSSSEASG